MRYELGARVRDLVTGVEGLVVGRAEWITGCDTYMVQPRTGDDGRTRPEAIWVDEPRLQCLAEETEEGKRIKDAIGLPGGEFHPEPPARVRGRV